MPLIKTTHYSQKCFLMVFFTLIVWKNFDLLSLLLKGKEGQKQRERERIAMRIMNNFSSFGS